MRARALDVRGERRGGRGRVGEQGLEPDDVGGALVDVGDDAPAALLAGGEREVRADQVGALLAADLPLRDDGPAGRERADLAHGQQVVDVVEADLPGDRRRERLARVGLVGERRVQVDEPETGRGVDLGTLVRVEQAAQLALRLHRDARGQQVDEPVEDLRLDGPVCRRGDLDLAHDAVPGRGAPRHAHAQPQVGAALLEHERRAERVLVEVAVGVRVTRPVRREGLPERGAHTQERQPAGPAGTRGDLVLGGVGEQRAVGLLPPGGDAAGAGDEQPQVARADERHEERRQVVVGRDAVEASAVEVDESGSGGGVEHHAMLSRECRGDSLRRHCRSFVRARSPGRTRGPRRCGRGCAPIQLTRVTVEGKEERRGARCADRKHIAGPLAALRRRGRVRHRLRVRRGGRGPLPAPGAGLGAGLRRSRATGLPRPGDHPVRRARRHPARRPGPGPRRDRPGSRDHPHARRRRGAGRAPRPAAWEIRPAE